MFVCLYRQIHQDEQSELIFKYKHFDLRFYGRFDETFLLIAT